MTNTILNNPNEDIVVMNVVEYSKRFQRILIDGYGKCSTCGEDINWKKKHWEYLENEHGTCMVCRKVFKTKIKLRDHERNVHTNHQSMYNVWKEVCI